ncbi:hypothetical protein GCM10015535_38890 [Streptomyces gelaticus]|uniref:Uncharacterized protein n=1 Tax=Streptomyces gelaticus TaxID=285446 RepID=A0ABQ2W4D1_9ACTN|nr:hypothetical protein GCM10015535_38890 [Streptomyces gelaticus]
MLIQQVWPVRPRRLHFGRRAPSSSLSEPARIEDGAARQTGGPVLRVGAWGRMTYRLLPRCGAG